MSNESNGQVVTVAEALQPPTYSTVQPAREPPKLSIVLPDMSDIDHETLNWSSAEVQSQLPTDVLLITANDHEFIACYSYMKEVQKSHHKKSGLVYFGQFAHGQRHVKVALMKCNQGPGKAQTAVTNGATTLNPKVVLFVGICGTLRPEKAKLGDVVISNKLQTFGDQKVNADDTVEDRNIKTNVSRNMAQLILHAAQGWKPPLEDPSSLKIKVHDDAVMLSGSELVNNRRRREQLAHDFHPALGLEMEGKGR